MALNKLSSRGIDAFKDRGRVGDGGGLWLNVTAAGTRSWVFRWTPRGGSPREMGLGSYSDVSLADARELATQHRRTAASGKDPKLVRDLSRVVPKTFGEIVPDFIEAKSANWKNPKSKSHWVRSLTIDCEAISNRPISEINEHDVLKVLKPMWARVPETARRTRGRIEAFLNFTKAQNLREGDNPAVWKGNLEYSLAKPNKSNRTHFAAMPWWEVPVFVARLKSDRTATSARALEFAILTAARTKETLHAVWSEIDFENALWTLPKERMLKNGKEHRVPLSPRAMEILEPLFELRHSDYVFAGMKPNKPLSLMAMEMLMRRMKVDNATPHGFRSSFRDWAGDHDFSREVAEAALSHLVENDVERAYRRGDALEKRRHLMDAWANYCAGGEIGNVVQLHA